MTDSKKSKLWKGRAEWLSKKHRAESVAVYFDADLLAVVISTGCALAVIPMGEASDLSSLLSMIANQLLEPDLI